MQKFTRDDFSNQAEVRWCPGCGDYAILMALQKTLAELGVPPEKHVFISGIGCAGRLPYYMNCYGFHTIHGRAPAVATGLKALREDLHVWLITGDGDALSIGTNHLIHCLRRNLKLTILLFNNQVYGLTKGQFSPTSPPGQISKTSPAGVEQEPITPLVLALAAKASFVAKAVDKDPAQISRILKQAYSHQGTSFIEIYQDCNVFNHGAFDSFTLKTNRLKSTLTLEEGKPLIFGENQEFILNKTLEGFKVEPKEQSSLETAYKHEPKNFMAAMGLARLQYPDFPVPLGVYYQEERPVYTFKTEIKKTRAELEGLFKAKASWVQD